jgi:hypothetical protein
VKEKKILWLNILIVRDYEVEECIKIAEEIYKIVKVNI